MGQASLRGRHFAPARDATQLFDSLTKRIENSCTPQLIHRAENPSLPNDPHDPIPLRVWDSDPMPSRPSAACRTVMRLTLDAFTLLRMSLQSRTALAAENLFLRKELAFYRERQIKPRRADRPRE